MNIIETLKKRISLAQGRDYLSGTETAKEAIVLKLVKLADIRIILNLNDSEVQDELFLIYRASFTHLSNGRWQVN